MTMPQPSMSPRLALVTGASAGIGAAFAHAYAARGCDVVLVARRAERLEQLAQELLQKHGVRATALPSDLAEADATEVIVAHLKASGRTIDILVNNAGFGVPQTFAAVPWQRHRDFIMTMVTNVCALTHALLPGMIERGFGRIVNVSSMAAFSPGAAGHTLYPAAKSFVLKFSQSLDAELHDKGIFVTAVCPGFTRTEFHEASGMAEKMEQAPRRFWTSAEDVVKAAIDGNERGHTVVIPGWHNQLAAAAMKYLPEALTAPIIRAGAAKYRIEE